MRLAGNNVYPFVRPPRRGLGCCGNNLSGMGDALATAADLFGAMYGGPGGAAAGAAAASALAPPDAGAGAGVPGAAPGMGPITVSPAIQTTVSPQISPVFQQSYMPSGSPMSAGTTQTAPVYHSAATGVPQPSSMPSAPSFGPDMGASPMPSAGGFPVNYATPSNIPMSTVPGTTFNWMPWAIGGGVGLIVLIVLMKKKKTTP